MIWKKLIAKTFLFGLVLGPLLSAVIVSGCTGDARLGASPDPDHTAVGQAISEPETGESAGEHGSGLEGSESKEEGSGGSEHGFGGEGSSTGSEGGVESREAAMSSPITPLRQSWNGVLGGLAVSAQYDAATQSVHATVQNTLSETLCYVQAEPHLKSGTITVGELGPDKLGHLNPGQEATSSLTVTVNWNLREFPTTDTWFTWKYSTAVAPAPLRIQEKKALKAAAVNIAPAVNVVMNPGPKKVVVPVP